MMEAEVHSRPGAVAASEDPPVFSSSSPPDSPVSSTTVQALENISISGSSIDVLKNDFIILKLGSPLQFNENVQPACLPSSSSFLGLDSTKTSCFTSGWGKLNFSKCNSINVLCNRFSGRNNFSSMYFHVNS